MKFLLRIFLVLIITLFCFTSCNDNEINTEIELPNEFEEIILSKYTDVIDIKVEDNLETRQLSVYVVCTDLKKNQIDPIFEEFYNYYFDDNSKHLDTILKNDPYVSIIFHLKDDIVLKYVCNYPSRYKEKWSVYVNTEFDSYYIHSQTP